MFQKLLSCLVEFAFSRRELARLRSEAMRSVDLFFYEFKMDRDLSISKIDGDRIDRMQCAAKKFVLDSSETNAKEVAFFLNPTDLVLLPDCLEIISILNLRTPRKSLGIRYLLSVLLNLAGNSEASEEIRRKAEIWIYIICHAEPPYDELLCGDEYAVLYRVPDLELCKQAIRDYIQCHQRIVCYWLPQPEERLWLKDDYQARYRICKDVAFGRYKQALKILQLKLAESPKSVGYGFMCRVAGLAGNRRVQQICMNKMLELNDETLTASYRHWVMQSIL